MFAFLYLTFWSILLLVAEVLLRSAGLSVPLLGFFFSAAAFAKKAISSFVSSCPNFFFSMISSMVMRVSSFFRKNKPIPGCPDIG